MSEDPPLDHGEYSRAAGQSRPPSAWWRSTPERRAEWEGLPELAAGDRLRSHWRQRWMFEDDQEFPFPLLVSTTVDEESRTLLARLDEIGIPYHQRHKDIETGPPFGGPRIWAPFWDERVTGDSKDEGGKSFGTPTNALIFEGSFDDLFAHFHERSPSAPPEQLGST